MSLLGDDGRGFELARKLESLGIWRSWLGDTLYSSFLPFLSSPAAWDSFLRSDDSKPKSLLHLQLRVRSLLFDKASVSLSLQNVTVSNLNPSYLQLHGDDVYFTLEDSDQRSNTASSKRFRNEELPENWYSQFAEKSRVGRAYRVSENEKRSSEEMLNYLRVIDRHKRKRVAIKEDAVESSSSLVGSDYDTLFFPETMFLLNCVPESALPVVVRAQNDKKIEFHGVLDVLPQMTRNSVVIERLGISVEQDGGLHRGKNGGDARGKVLSHEQALQMSQKVVVNVLGRVGFEGATEVPVEIFSQLLRCHVGKLGRMLKVLADSYRKQCSAIELLKMFLQTSGHSNLASLVELVKEGTRDSMQPTQQQVLGMQSHLQSQQQNALRLAQQIPRQMHPQMQQMLQSQNLGFQQQQQLERMRRRQQSAIRPGMDMDKDRPLVQVKLENPDFPVDNHAFNALQSRHPQMQFRQQQLAAMSNFHPQSTNQLRQLASMQVSQMQTPNMGGVVRAPPVKVEGFSELMGGGDNVLKHDSEENKLTSPSSK